MNNEQNKPAELTEKELEGVVGGANTDGRKKGATVYASVKWAKDIGGLVLQKDIRENPEVAREYYREAMKAIVNGDNEVANTMFRDLVNAGIGFQRLAKETGISAPNLHRALSVRGNPTMRTFGKIAASISAFLGFQTPMAVFS